MRRAPVPLLVAGPSPGGGGVSLLRARRKIMQRDRPAGGEVASEIIQSMRAESVARELSSRVVSVTDAN